MLARALLLGFVGGALIGELGVLALLLVVDDRMQSLWMAGLVLPIGGLIGAADGLLVLPVFLLLDRPMRRCMPLASMVGGLAAATPPLLALWQIDWLRYLPGMVLLPGIAFLAGSALTWPVLTGRSCLACSAGRIARG
jgi:hypothetical protein